MPSSPAHAASESVRYHVSGSIARITIARPGRRNALDETAWRQLHNICMEICARPDVHAVLLTGEGGHFSAGADIHELSQHLADIAWLQQNQSTIAAAIDCYASLPQPTVAVIRGSCVGGGAALAAASDFRLAAAGCRFAITPAKLGLTYRLVDCLRIVELVGAAHARELLLLAAECDGDKALAWGLINALFPADDFDAGVDQWLQKMTGLSSASQRGIKSNLLKIRAGATNDDDDSRRIFAEAFAGADFIRAATSFATAKNR
jgi:enoyl-CoA hydratase/carnithine racemase